MRLIELKVTFSALFDATTFHAFFQKSLMWLLALSLWVTLTLKNESLCSPLFYRSSRASAPNQSKRITHTGLQSCFPGIHTMGSLLSYRKGLNEELLTENFMQFYVGRMECKGLTLTSMADVGH